MAADNPLNFDILQGPYLADLLAQPRAIADTLDGLAACAPLRIPTATRMILTGMGSSLHGLYPLAVRLAATGRPAIVIETAELVHAQPKLFDADPTGAPTVVIAVSQSGRSAETVLLLDRIETAIRKPFLVGVTNTADSPLATRADAVVPLAAGPEFSVSCKTYLATLVALEWLGSALCADDVAATLEGLRPAVSAVDQYLNAADAHVRELTKVLAGVRHVFVTGRGTSLAAVGTGALILKESTRIHAEGMSSPAFRHGPLEMVGPELFAVVLAGDPATADLNARLVRDIVAAGGRAALVGDDVPGGVFRLPKGSPRLRPVMEMLPLQMMSLALAALAGRQPGVFERASKVTDTE